MQNFQQWLDERQQKGVKGLLLQKLADKKKIHIFDFDATLFATHEPEVGKKIHKDVTGNEWPFQGWWGRPESLEEPFASQIVPNETVANAFKQSKSDPESLTILMTGRHDDTLKKDKKTGVYSPNPTAKMVPNIHALLRKHGLVPDIDIYKTGREETYAYKTNMIELMLLHQPEIEELHLWDDRYDHVWGDQSTEGFVRFLRKMKQTYNVPNVVVHHVVNGQISSHQI